MNSKDNTIKLALRTPFTMLLSLREVITSPRMIIYLIPPYLIGGIAAFLVFFSVSDLIFSTLTSWLTPNIANWPDWIEVTIMFTIKTVITIMSWLFAGVISAIAGIFALSILAAYFVECFIEIALKRHGLAPKLEPTFFRSIMRGLKDEGKKLVVIGFIALIALVASFLPFLAPVALLLGILLIGYDLFDIPLTLAGFSFSERFKLIIRHPAELVSLGGIFSVIAIIPGLPILLLPLGYLTAIKNVRGWSIAPTS